MVDLVKLSDEEFRNKLMTKEHWDKFDRDFIAMLIKLTNENFEAGDYDEVNTLEVD